MRYALCKEAPQIQHPKAFDGVTSESSQLLHSANKFQGTRFLYESPLMFPLRVLWGLQDFWVFGTLARLDVDAATCGIWFLC